MSFNIPERQIIVNDDSQVRLLEDDGSVYLAADASPSAGGFILEGWLSLVNGSQLQLLRSATRIVKTTPSAGNGESAAWTVALVGSGPAQGDVVRLVFDTLNLTPTEFQNRESEKRYQFSSAKTSVATIISHLVATINADPKAPVTAYAGFNNATPAQDDSAKIVLVAKSGTFYNVDLYVGEVANVANSFTLTKVANGTTVYHTVEDTNVVTARAALPINTYDYLKNIEWAKNLDFDRNVNWMPLPGVSYNGYYFEVNGTVQATVGSNPIPSEVHNSVRTSYKLWVKTGLTLATKMDLLVTDMNV